MKSINKVILLGRLGGNPILRQTKLGYPVAHFSVATSSNTKRSSIAVSPINPFKAFEEEIIYASNEANEFSSDVPPAQEILEEDLEEVKNSQNEETQWHQIVCWGKQAQAVSLYLKKGHAVYVEGILKTSSYEDTLGENKMSVEIHAKTISFIGHTKK